VALIGLVVGVLVGISGVGGSSLVTPLMILVMRVPPLVAVGTDLAYSVPTKLVGAFIHRQQGTIDRRLVGYLCLGGLPAAGLGLLVLFTLRAYVPLEALNAALQRALGVLLFLVAVLVILLPLLKRKRARRVEQQSTAPVGGQSAAPSAALPRDRASIARIVGLGAVVGFCVSLTSIGSGSLTLPMLFLLLPAFNLRRLVGADVTFAALLVPVAALGHAQMGGVDFALTGNLLLGSLPGVVLGSKLCRYLPDLWLRPAIAGVLLFAGTRLL
jgi:uncharacterized membrane protein YfcA